MSHFEIVHLESYRARREARFRRATVLHGPDPKASSILQRLWGAVSVAEGDRGAVVWVDEYGPGLTHPHTVLDLASDRPRRVFSTRPLRMAGNTRVPGMVDLPLARSPGQASAEGAASLCAVALGSDGPRSWFLLVDSLTPRPALKGRAAAELMFLAGEIASIVLHPDLARVKRKSLEAGAGPEDDPVPFSCWPVLKDLEDRHSKNAVSRRVGDRFLVARLVRGLVDDNLVVDDETLGDQLRTIRAQLDLSLTGDREVGVWDRVLSGVEKGDIPELTAAVLEWGRLVEGEGHLHGALELLELAFELAKATGSASAATDAARSRGKVFRTMAEWDLAQTWYETAREIAEEAGDTRKLAMVMDGLANAFRDRGNLPRAGKVLKEVLEIGEKTGDRYALAIGHHDLMTVDKLRGDLDSAILHGWAAVNHYESKDGVMRALFDLGGTLRERGELGAAWDAYSVVMDQVEGLEARILCLDALAYVAALRGEEGLHRQIREEMDAEDWEKVAPVYRGQVLLYRGLSLRALRKEKEARECLEGALAFAEDHGLNKLVFDAEAALEASKEEQAPSGTDLPQDSSLTGELLGVCRGLREMRGALATAGGRFELVP